MFAFAVGRVLGLILSLDALGIPRKRVQDEMASVQRTVELGEGLAGGFPLAGDTESIGIKR